MVPLVGSDGKGPHFAGCRVEQDFASQAIAAGPQLVDEEDDGEWRYELSHQMNEIPTLLQSA